MTVDECIEELTAVFKDVYGERDLEGQKKRLRKGKNRFSIFTDDPQEHLRGVVNKVLLSKEERNMRDRRAEACRTCVVSLSIELGC